MEVGPYCRAPGRSWPEGCGDGLGALLRPLWAAWGIEGGARAVAASAVQVNGLSRLSFGGGGQASFEELGQESPGASPSASSTRSRDKGRLLPKVSGPVPGGPGSSQVCPAGPASRVTPGGDLGACDSILTCQTTARGPGPRPCCLVGRVVSVLAPSGNSVAQDPGPLRSRGSTCL